MAVPQHPVDRDGGIKVAVQVGIPVQPVRIGDGGQYRRVDPKQRADIRIPLEGADIEQLGAGGVGEVAAKFLAPGHLKDQPGIDRAGTQLLSGKVRRVLQHPRDLRGRKIGGKPQPGPFPHHFGVIRKPFADFRPAGALPDDRVVDRQAGLPVPDQRGLPLV